MSLFAGLRRAHGKYDMINPTLEGNGKLKGRAVTRAQPVTELLWLDHLRGVDGLGVVPINEESMCWFGAVDVDGAKIQSGRNSYSAFDAAAFARKIWELKLPCIPCRSKSGGIHVYMFSAEPVPAEQMIDRFREILTLLGLPEDTEIFPKQKRIIEGDNGSWINMPYFDAEHTERYAFDNRGETMNVEQFLKIAFEARQTAAFFERKLDHGQPLGSRMLPDGPPCLQTLITIGIPEGYNTTMFNIAKYFRRAYPEDWRARVRDCNNGFPDPLSAEELNRTMKSSEARGYFYDCAKSPLAGVCDSAVCRTRKFGVGREERRDETTDEPIPRFPVLGQLRRLNTEPPQWFLDVDSITIQLATEDLQTPLMFQRRIMQKTKSFIQIPTAASWQRMIQALMDNLAEIEAPNDSSLEGLFFEHLEKYCAKSEARAPDEILNGRIWADEERVHFKIYHLLRFLKNNQFQLISPAQVTVWLQNLGGSIIEIPIRRRKERVWSLPAFKKFEIEAESEEL